MQVYKIKSVCMYFETFHTLHSDSHPLPVIPNKLTYYVKYIYHKLPTTCFVFVTPFSERQLRYLLKNYMLFAMLV
jgi:hypothetical protein